MLLRFSLNFLICFLDFASYKVKALRFRAPTPPRTCSAMLSRRVIHRCTPGGAQQARRYKYVFARRCRAATLSASIRREAG